MRKLVLLVEDEPLLRWDLAQYLTFLGYNVIDCDSGPEALAHLHRAAELEAVITDIDLGGLITGADVAEAFAAVSPTIRVIFVSGRASRPEALKSRSVFLSKPVSFDDLASALAAQMVESI